MLEFLTQSKDDAIALLKSDHDKVKDLFDQFEKSDDRREKKKIAAQAIMELKIHATIEEEIFYPAVRRDVEDDLMKEADEEHHVAKLLIAELDQMNVSDEYFDAKFKVLSENIRHHIKEEEGKMMPEARKSDIDFDALGQKLLARKKELMKSGVPVSDEEKLMSRSGGRADSPRKAAQGKSRAGSKAGQTRTGSYSSSSRAVTKDTARHSAGGRKTKPKSA